MIEFKRAGDVMVFECPAFKIEVLADSERIELNSEAISIQNDALERISDAFEILDMMIEHKARHTHVLKMDINHEGLNSDIESLKKRLFDATHINCAAGK